MNYAFLLPPPRSGDSQNQSLNQSQNPLQNSLNPSQSLNSFNPSNYPSEISLQQSPFIDPDDDEVEADIISINRVVIKNFGNWLKRNNYESSTIGSYCRTVKKYQDKYKTISKNSLLAYRDHLIENYSPASANQKIYAINKYLEYSHKKSLRLKGVKIQNKPFLENVITDADCKYFCKRLRADKDETARKVYFLVRFIVTTGARPSELVRFRVDHVETGWMDIYSKGGKIRRVYIPTKLQKPAIKWIEEQGIESGTIFKNKNGQTITTRGVNKLLKEYAEKYKNIPLDTVYCYSFRHRYAINFLDHGGELMLLADLMGHSSLETTRRYTRMSSAEQYAAVNRIVTW